MAAPAVVPITAPNDMKLFDGFPCILQCGVYPDAALYMKSTKPPGIDGGEMIDITDMFNTLWRTGYPRKLLKLMMAEFKASYAVNVYNQIILHMVNVNTNWTVHFPDTGTVSFYGFLKSFNPDALEEGKQPEATVQIEVTNWDSTHNVEAGPAIAPASGT